MQGVGVSGVERGGKVRGEGRQHPARLPANLGGDQPELHLHPRAQAELGSFFLELFKRRVQAIVETHSEHLLLRVQTLVAEGRFNPDDVAIYYVKPTGAGKQVSRVHLNARGEFLDSWPDGFFPERLAEARALLKANHRRSA